MFVHRVPAAPVSALPTISPRLARSGAWHDISAMAGHCRRTGRRLVAITDGIMGAASLTPAGQTHRIVDIGPEHLYHTSLARYPEGLLASTQLASSVVF